MGKLMHRIQDSLGQMSARERKMVIGGGIAIVITIVFGGVWGASSHIGKLDQQVHDREDSLRQVQLLAMDHASNIEKAAKIQKILKDSRNTTVQSFVEKKAAEVGIQRDRLDSIKGKSPVNKADLEETAFTVQLSKLSLEDAMNFVHVIETANYPLVVRSAKFKTRKISGEKLIRLTLELAAYRSLTAEAGGE